MSVIATGSIGERIEIDRNIFFSFLNSSVIFPLGLAWCWNDGWIQNSGFIDYGGVSIVHVMGGLSGFVGRKEKDIEEDEEVIENCVLVCIIKRRLILLKEKWD